MDYKSHIDEDKLNKVPSGHPFEYKDVVSDDFPMEDHSEDGRIFKFEVEKGLYNNVTIKKDTGSHILYKKL